MNAGAVMGLWELCFGDSKDYMSYYERWKLGRNRVFTTSDGDELISMLHLNPYEVSVFGCRDVVDYVVGVATHPDYRHRGHMRELLRRAAREARSRGKSWLFLMPADPAIYLPFDYRFFYTQERLSPVCGEVPERGSATGLAWRDWEELGGDARAEAVRFSNELLGENADIYAVRSEAYYEDLAAERRAGGGALVFGFRGDEAAAEVAYFLEEGELSVTEILAAERGLADGYVAGLAARAEKAAILDARWTCLPGEHSRKPIMMARILDVEAFVGMLRGARPCGAEFVLEDPFLPEQSGAYRAELGECCRAERIAGREGLPVWSPGDLAEWIFANVPLRTVLNEIV